MSYTPRNLPDEIWSRLKEWARARAALPSHGDAAGVEDYHTRVAEIVNEVTGRRDGVPSDVAAFYARETAEMVLSFRAELARHTERLILAPQPESDIEPAH